MTSLVCQACKDDNRVTRPILVTYTDRRSGQRSSFYCCQRCDVVDLWPVFARQSPGLPKD